MLGLVAFSSVPLLSLIFAFCSVLFCQLRFVVCLFFFAVVFFHYAACCYAYICVVFFTVMQHFVAPALSFVVVFSRFVLS